ncbi:MAG: FMN-binding protein [Candidatus Geothermincolia bacterium]
MRKQIVHLGLTLFIVGLIAAVGLGLTYTVTRKKIAEQDRLSEAKAAVEALPGVKSPSELKLETGLATAARKAVPEVQKVYTCSQGTIFTIQMKGYGGPLLMAVGIDKEGKVAGAASISDRETIGLGSKTLEPAFLKQFNGKDSKSPLEVGKDIQAVTGATISSKAVTGEVKAALKAFAEIQ